MSAHTCFGRAFVLAFTISLAAQAGEARAQALDSDGDGIADELELEGDRDLDGLPNYLDPDDDNDTRLTRLEEDGTGLDRDQDGTPDYLDTDEDGDTLIALQEDANGDGELSPLDDTDGDGLMDALDADDDGDGVLTIDELGPRGAALPRDNDLDRIPDFRDPDDDNDGVPTRDELQLGEADENDNGVPAHLDPTESGRSATDSDGDGVSDGGDLDDDDDGVVDAREQPGDSDGDGAVDRVDSDDDGDHVPTRFEDASREPAQDSDGDGVADYLDGDDDGDGIPTAEEQPDLDGDGRVDDARSTAGGERDYLNADDDQDGVPTRAERPTGVDRDSDGDGLPDQRDPDDDGDGLATSLEVGRDSDGDGILDYLESDDDGDGIATSVECASTVVLDYDGDGLDNCRDLDSDQDSVPDATEGVLDRDRNGKPDYLDAETIPDDADKDGVPDQRECAASLTVCPDLDLDGLPDVNDDDDDGDGLLTRAEDGQHGLDSDGDGRANYLDTDDDGDGIATARELGAALMARDLDRDGIADYLDTDDDGDGKPTLVEGEGDEDGDGIPDYLDAHSDGPTDGGSSPLPDAAAPAPAPDGGLLTFEPVAADEGCSVSARATFGGSLTWLCALGALLALQRRRRTRTGIYAGLLALVTGGCDGEPALAQLDGALFSDGGPLDATLPLESDAAALDSGAMPSRGCLGDELTFALAVSSGARPAFDMTMFGNRAEVVYLGPGCGSTPAIAQTSAIRHVSFTTSGDAGATSSLGTSDCVALREPSLVAHAQTHPALFVGAGDVSDVRYAVLDGTSALAAQTDTSELHEVAFASAVLVPGAAPTLAFVQERSRAISLEPAALATLQPGKITEELLPRSAQQRPTKLAISPLATRSPSASGVVAWVNNLAPQTGIYARLVNQLGQGAGELKTLTLAVGAQSSVAVARRDDVTAIAYSESIDNVVHELRFRSIASDGELSDPLKLTAASQDVLHVALSPYRNGFAVAYRSRATAIHPQSAIKLLFIDQRGEVGGLRHIAETTASGTKLAVSTGNDGRLILAWDEASGALDDAGAPQQLLRVMRLTCS